MELEDVMRPLRNYIRERFQIQQNDPDFNDDVHLFDYGYVDSFGAVELNTFVETQFGVKITGSDLIAYPLNTVREIASFVTTRLKG